MHPDLVHSIPITAKSWVVAARDSTVGGSQMNCSQVSLTHNELVLPFSISVIILATSFRKSSSAVKSSTEVANAMLITRFWNCTPVNLASLN